MLKNLKVQQLLSTFLFQSLPLPSSLTPTHPHWFSVLFYTRRGDAAGYEKRGNISWSFIIKISVIFISGRSSGLVRGVNWVSVPIIPPICPRSPPLPPSSSSSSSLIACRFSEIWRKIGGGTITNIKINSLLCCGYCTNRYCGQERHHSVVWAAGFTTLIEKTCQ